MNKADGLIKVLLNKSARIDERDDAAMDLSQFSDNKVLSTLLKIGSDPEEEEIILNSCGESLAEIWVKCNFFDVEAYNKLVPAARQEAYGVIFSEAPQWIEKYDLK